MMNYLFPFPSIKNVMNNYSFSLSEASFCSNYVYSTNGGMQYIRERLISGKCSKVFMINSVQLKENEIMLCFNIRSRF